MRARRESADVLNLGAAAAPRASSWALSHLQALFSSLGRLFRAPAATLMTAGVIGVSLALPATLLVVLDNVQRMSRSWDGTARISVYLDPAADDETARRIARELRLRREVESVRVITRNESLAEFRERSGLGSVLDAFEEENPLPAVLVVIPRPGYATGESLARVAADVGRRPEVEVAEFDRQWLQRLDAMTEIVRRGALVLAVLLAVGVFLIVGNTIRLGIESQRDAIEVQKLCGATDRFVRRPFLYAGVWYGLLGGVVAWFTAAAALGLLHGPVEHLAGLYMARFHLEGLDLAGAAALIATGAVLGLAGSWLAVGRHLRAIQPG